MKKSLILTLAVFAAVLLSCGDSKTETLNKDMSNIGKGVVDSTIAKIKACESGSEIPEAMAVGVQQAALQWKAEYGTEADFSAF